MLNDNRLFPAGPAVRIARSLYENAEVLAYSLARRAFGVAR